MSTAEIVEDSVINGSVSSSTEPVANRRGAPMKKSNKIRSKQPRSSKKVKFITTEIRCQEKSKGGLSYEVILAEPAPNVTLPKRPVTPGKNVSAEEIEQKLKAAEERRLSLEAKKMAELSAKMEKIEEASRKKDEINNEFIKQTKEELEIKMQKYEEQREAIISDLKEKLKTHSQEIEKTRNSLEQQKYVERIAIDEKLKSAASLRDDNLKKMLERLKEHNTVKIAEIKSQIDALESQKVEEKARIIENKLYTAQQNREKAFQQKLENIRKHERRAEIVRQNKAALGGGNGATNNQNECENNLISAASD